MFSIVWNAVEGCLLKQAGSLFFDDLNECLETRDEIKE